MTDKRYYYWGDDFVVIDNVAVMSPVLIPRMHNSPVPKEAFKQANRVGALLYGEHYTLELAGQDTDHYVIRIHKLGD